MTASGPTANQIKAQLKTLLTPIIGTSGTFKTLIFDYSPLAFKPGEQEDPTILRSLDDTAQTAGGEIINRINCLIITEDSWTQEMQWKDSTLMETRPKGKVIITRKFLLTTFYQFGEIVVGNDPNTESSENMHSAINEAIRVELNNQPRLGFAVVGAAGIAGQGAHVSHSGLQNPEPYLDSLAGTICHVSVMPFTVRVIESLG